MNSILNIIALYFAQMTFGSLFLIPFFPHRVAGKSFTRFYYGMSLVFFGLFLFCLWRLNQINTNQLIILAFSIWVWIMSLTPKLQDFEEYLYYLLSATSVVWLGLYFKNQNFPHDSFWTFTPFVLSFFLSTLFLCGHVMNMIFGHWYLVNRQLPISHLVTTTRRMMYLTFIKLAQTGFTVYWAYTHLDAQALDSLFSFLGHGIFFWSRILAGLGVPALVSVLAYQSAKIGSNQSATGIMYAGCVFVLMGEFLAVYLFAITGYFF